jgi:uridine kinase
MGGTIRRERMPARVSIDDVIARIARGVYPPLIAVDGLPCAGKTTLVEYLRSRIDLECMQLDEFVLTERDWPSRNKPAFPFEFIRYDEFLAAIIALALSGQCAYRPFDWEKLEISTELRIVRMTKPVVVEGVSSLNPSVCHLYGLRIFVESDRTTALAAANDRGAGVWGNEWRDLFLPSADIYMRTHPEGRADLLVPGRGLS